MSRRRRNVRRRDIHVVEGGIALCMRRYGRKPSIRNVRLGGDQGEFIWREPADGRFLGIDFEEPEGAYETVEQLEGCIGSGGRVVGMWSDLKDGEQLLGSIMVRFEVI